MTSSETIVTLIIAVKAITLNLIAHISNHVRTLIQESQECLKERIKDAKLIEELRDEIEKLKKVIN